MTSDDGMTPAKWIGIASGNKEALERMPLPGKGERDFTLTKVSLESCYEERLTPGDSPSRGFSVAWETESAGFGHLEFHLRDGQLYCDSEAMGPDFCEKVLAMLFESAKPASEYKDEIKPTSTF